MSHSFASNMSLALKHELRVRQIIGATAVLPSSLVVDRSQGKDFFILSDAAGMGCAARVRRGHAARYSPWEFTIRSKAVNGGPTEYEKFRGGMCNWYLYAILNERGDDFARWMLINLAAWRLAEHKRETNHGLPLWCDYRKNTDGSEFYVYNATAPRLLEQHGFMVDCSDHSYPGRVHCRDLYRSANDNTLGRFMRRA